MLLYNIKYAIRRMWKNKVFSSLNITGFAIGFAATIILTLFIYKEYTVDHDFDNHKQIYRLVDAKTDKVKMDYDIAKMIKDKYPDIEFATPLYYLNSSIQIFLSNLTGEEVIEVNSAIATSNDFFDIFSINTILSEESRPFANNNSLVLTQSTAVKLFGRIDVLGEEVDVNNMFVLPVSAVVEDLPENSSLSAEVFLNSENEQFRFSSYCNEGTCYNPLDQYIRVNELTNISELEKNMNNDFPINKSKIDSIKLQPLSDIYLTDNITDNSNKAGSKGLLMVFLTITLLVILMSVFNYVNFSLSNQLSTLKELGIKITNGAGTRHLKSAYLTEVTLFVVVSFLIALGISFVILPYAEILLDSTLQLEWLFSPVLLYIFTLIILSVILIATLAPVYIISRFDIQRLFGKKETLHAKQTGKKILTVFQVAVTILLLICLISIQKQLTYVKTTNLGFNQEQLLKLNFPRNFVSQNTFKQQIDNLSFVKNSTLSQGSPGRIQVGAGATSENEDFFMMNCIYIDSDFLKTFEIELLEGREFLSSDIETSCYINEVAFKKYGWDNIENKKFDNLQKEGFNVIGIVKDFNVESLHKLISPVCLVFKEQYSALNIRLNQGDLENQMNMIEEVWNRVIPNAPFSYTFYDDYFDSMYKKEDRQSKAIVLFSIVALLITCLGLMGQVFQLCVTRIKEIGIRKVNGAKVSEILTMLNKDFVKWVLIAFLIASPIAYYAINKWLENFAYKTSLSWWIFALAGLLALGIALLTVSWQSWRAATRNPVEALRYE